MARRAKEPDLGTEQKEHHITEALERKRRQLDHEIAQFKAEKDYDYSVFERRLRDKSKENGVRDASQSQRKRGRSKQKNAAAEVGSTHKEGANWVQRELGNGNALQKSLGEEAEDPFVAVRSSPSPKHSPGPSGPFTEALHEREKEFQRVFTPSYLPLVEDTPGTGGSRSKGRLEPPHCNSEDILAARHNGTAMLSSSAETTHPPMTSPPLQPARPLSSSVPPENPLHHRSDSSRSDNSVASLRSSLRDPKQPRSPKRVLFSIDDTLVSPSTSPVAQRSRSRLITKPADSDDLAGGFEKFEVVRNQNGSALAVDNSKTNGAIFPSAGVEADGWTTSLLTFDRTAESKSSKTPPSAGGADDFEHLDSDDLFTFDEDMGRTGESKPQEPDPGDEYEEDLEVNAEKGKDSLTGSSPHAGSLPIEIKWPGRREDRG